MIFECDRKIKASRNAMKNTEAGRKEFMENISKLWDSLLPAGADELGWEELKTMQEIVAP